MTDQMERLAQQWKMCVSEQKQPIELELRAGRMTARGFQVGVSETVFRQVMDHLQTKTPDPLVGKILQHKLFHLHDECYQLGEKSYRVRTATCTVNGTASSPKTTIICKSKVAQLDCLVVNRVCDARIALKREEELTSLPKELVGASPPSLRKGTRSSFLTSNGCLLDLTELVVTGSSTNSLDKRFEVEVEAMNPVMGTEELVQALQDWFAYLVPSEDDSLLVVKTATSNSAAASASAASVASCTGVAKGYHFYLPWRL